MAGNNLAAHRDSDMPPISEILSKQAGEQRHENGAHNRDAGSGHELFDPLRFRARIVVSVTLQKIDNSPNSEAAAQCDNEGLQSINRACEKVHKNTEVR